MLALSFLLLFLLSTTTNAFQFPFKIPNFFRSTVPVADLVADVLDDPSAPPRIAIIGAGAGGSSAAFFIHKAKERFGLNVEIDVYDKAAYVGGRSIAVHPYDDDTYPAVELGGAIFIKANRNMWRASEEFNLTRRDFDKEDGPEVMGIWDGKDLRFTFSGGWLDMIKMAWRYGVTSPMRTDKVVKAMVKQFGKLYTVDTPRWDDIDGLAKDMEWTDLLSQSISSFLQSKGVSQQYISELVEAATRVNYGQNADEIHALGGAVSLAPNDATGIKGGNYKIFEHFLKESNATLFLNTTVTSIVPKPSNSKHWTVRTETGATNYKAVILAAPLHSSNIVVPLAVSDAVPTHPYVRLHVTLLTTTLSSLPPQSLGLPDNVKVPGMLLTTDDKRNSGIESEFNSLSWHGRVSDTEHVAKIFSKQEVSDEWLEKMFNGTVGWVHRKVWDAYPKLIPNAKFAPVKLDEGFMYLNSMEPFISTMETSIISARNAVDLLLNEVFRSSICGARLPAATAGKSRTDDPDFVFGWDC